MPEVAILLSFLGFVTALLLLILGWVLKINSQMGKYDDYTSTNRGRIEALEKRVESIDKMNGMMDRLCKRLDKIELLSMLEKDLD